MNHISHKVPGVEFSTGALGHGLPFGVGKALFAKRNKMNWHTYVLMSDGELDEGSNWEAFLFSSHCPYQKRASHSSFSAVIVFRNSSSCSGPRNAQRELFLL